MTTVAEKPTQRSTRTRSDALRNRERIVAAAREMFVEYGPEAPLDEIARRAGIGNATLYRHFPDRNTLIQDVLISVMVRTSDHAKAAADQESDPFAALCRFAHAAVDERIGAMCGILTCGVGKGAAGMDALSERLNSAVEALLERSRRSGQLRSDVTVADLLVTLSQLSRPLPGADITGTDEVAHRHLQMFLDGLRASAPSGTAGHRGGGRTSPAPLPPPMYPRLIPSRPQKGGS